MRQQNLMVLADPEWIEVLRVEAAKPGRSKQAIADELGVSRTAVSLLCAGKYSAKMDKVSAKIAPKVVALYAHKIWCPHVSATISSETCDGHARAPMSTSDPVKLRQWAACRACPHNPTIQKSEVNDAV